MIRDSKKRETCWAKAEYEPGSPTQKAIRSHSPHATEMVKNLCVFLTYESAG